MKPSSADPCMYFMKYQQHQEDDLVLCFLVDNGLLMGVEAKLEEFLQKLKTRFEVTVSEVDNYLGMQINKNDDGAIEINQEVKIERLRQQYGMTSETRETANRTRLVAW